MKKKFMMTMVYGWLLKLRKFSFPNFIQNLILFFFGSITLSLIVQPLQTKEWSEWGYLIILFVGVVVLFIRVYRRKILFNEKGIRLLGYGNTHYFGSDRFIPWRQIKKMKLKVEDRKNYLFGREFRRGSIILRIKNEDIKLRLILNPEDIFYEWSQYTDSQ